MTETGEIPGVPILMHGALEMCIRDREEPGRFLEDFKAAGADLITVHAEACIHPVSYTHLL